MSISYYPCIVLNETLISFTLTKAKKTKEKAPTKMEKPETTEAVEREEKEEKEEEEEVTHNTHHPSLPTGLTETEISALTPNITRYHTYALRQSPTQCSSLLSQRIRAPSDVVWSIVRRFDHPQTYKHFIKSCNVSPDFNLCVGSTRDVCVISGLPAETSTERLDLLDEPNKVFGFSIIGGEHRLRNYRSVTTVHRFEEEKEVWTVVLESYVVDVPEGNTQEDTRLFADTVVKLNLHKLASVAEAFARDPERRLFY